MHTRPKDQLWGQSRYVEMHELIRFLNVHIVELLFMTAAGLLAYGIARFASAGWQFALLFSIAPCIVFLMHEKRILADLSRLLF